MDKAEQSQILADFLNNKCWARYSDDPVLIRFIAKDITAANQFVAMGRLAAELGVPPSGRDLTFFTPQKVSRLEGLGVVIDRSIQAQQKTIIDR